MANDFLFTSESVSEGHPDKVADQISDAILDAVFAQDPRSRVAAETLTNTGLVVLAGEITTNAHVDYIQVARDTIKRIGYDNTEYKELFTEKALLENFLVNPTGKFVIGGPVGDAGLTGRKIIVDTYGGAARHGGGAFSGKDPSKVDRSAAYAA
ncbi:MAG TPA: methionine adenosyltransferase domain-containing protein, partial [Ramlibacter sp.]|nr:methionine adenosyltransferase domain-containing protein [Ramlibacter sp.]